MYKNPSVIAPWPGPTVTCHSPRTIVGALAIEGVGISADTVFPRIIVVSDIGENWCTKKKISRSKHRQTRGEPLKKRSRCSRRLELNPGYSSSLTAAPPLLPCKRGEYCSNDDCFACTRKIATAGLGSLRPCWIRVMRIRLVNLFDFYLSVYGMLYSVVSAFTYSFLFIISILPVRSLR